MATDNQTLTDALNATLITYNGNEMMLQNDMGNTKIQDSKTGNIMGLSEGFIPVGMKEHGGIMYIASVNKEGKGEIGTIPSPIYTLTHEEFEDSVSPILVDENGPIPTQTILNNHKLYPGDKFVIKLPIITQDNSIQTFDYWYNGTQMSYTPQLISKVGSKGLYNIKLYSVYDTSVTQLDKAMSESQKYFDGGQIKNSDYWFIPADIDISGCVEQMHIAKMLKTYPGLPAGRLAVRAELENISSFGLIEVLQSSTAKQDSTKYAPYIKRNEEDGIVTYDLIFPGFQYKLDSDRFIGSFTVTLEDQKTSTKLISKEFTEGEFRNITENEIKEGEKIIQIRSTKDSIFYIQDTSKRDAPDFTSILDPVTLQPSDLNKWYRISIKYFDLYGGEVDSFTCSFNPYHIWNYSDNYYNLAWVSNLQLPQYYDFAESYEFRPNIQASHSTSCTTTYGNLVPSSVSKNEHESGDIPTFDHTWVIPTSTGSSNQDVVSVFTLGSVGDYSYLYTEDDSRSAKYNLTLPQGKIVFNYDISDGKGSVLESFHGLTLSAEHQPVIKIGGTEEIIKMEFNTSAQNDVSLSFKGVDTSMELNLPITTTSISYQLNHNLIKPEEVTLVGSRTDDKWQYDYEDTPLQLSLSQTRTDVVTASSLTIEQGYSFPLSSSYQIVPQFTLCGNTEEKYNVTLGLDRNGKAVEAWSFSKNYTNLLKTPLENVDCSFVDEPSYIDTVGQLSTIILSAGVYLINIQALEQTEQAEFKINDSYSVIKKNYDGKNYFVPTLLYLPSRTIVTFTWTDIQKFTGLGVCPIYNKNIELADGSFFNQGNEIKVMYYQSESIKEGKEPILPICATYYEKNVKCLDKTYDYYPGPSNAFYIDRHFVGDVMQEFVYIYSLDDPFVATVSEIDGVNNNLTYRLLNN